MPKRIKAVLEGKDIPRIIMHFLVGIFTGWLIAKLGWYGVFFGMCFIFYEALEDWAIHDMSFKDVFGFLCGVGLFGFYIVVRYG